MDTSSSKKRQQPAPTAPTAPTVSFVGLPEALVGRVVAFLPQWDAASVRQLSKDMRSAVNSSIQGLYVAYTYRYKVSRDPQALRRLLQGLPSLQQLSGAVASADMHRALVDRSAGCRPILTTMSCSNVLITSRPAACTA